MMANRFEGQRIKVLVRRNLKMSGYKVAAQSVHAVLGLTHLIGATVDEQAILGNLTCVILDASDQKFQHAIRRLTTEEIPHYVFTDSGFTEVAEGTVTCMAFLEPDPKEAQRAKNN